MKSVRRFILLFAVLFVSFFSLSQKAAADCPPGWDPGSVSESYEGCDFTIHYCYSTDAMGVLNTRIDYITFGNNCLDVIGTSDFWNYINQTLLEKLMNDNAFPPCPVLTYNVIYSRAKCWKVINDHVKEECTILNCGYEGECRLLYKICTDFTHIPPKVVKELVGTQSVDNEMCTGEMPDLSEYNPNEDWTTECFVLGCDLD